jgi:hypothetical protein
MGEATCTKWAACRCGAANRARRFLRCTVNNLFRCYNTYYVSVRIQGKGGNQAEGKRDQRVSKGVLL